MTQDNAMATGDTVPLEGKLRFEVDCGLLFQLGEELVAKRYVALGELIKNAYDADATAITIEFKNVTPEQAFTDMNKRLYDFVEGRRAPSRYWGWFILSDVVLRETT